MSSITKIFNIVLVILVFMYVFVMIRIARDPYKEHNRKIKISEASKGEELFQQLFRELKKPENKKYDGSTSVKKARNDLENQKISFEEFRDRRGNLKHRPNTFNLMNKENIEDIEKAKLKEIENDEIYQESIEISEKDLELERQIKNIITFVDPLPTDSDNKHKIHLNPYIAT